MADSNTEPAPAPDGTQADHGSEFSKGTGTEDASIWDKHFGKGAKEPKAKDSTPSKSSPKSESDGKPAAAKSKTSESGKKPSEKSTEPSKGKAEPTSSRKTDSNSSEPATKSKKSTSEDSADDTGQKTADDDKTEPADPEAPSKKARDLYAQAKKTEDPREARKLYKRALTEAFGEVPEEFNDKRYADVRKERAAANAALDAKAQKNEGRIREAADKLKPAIFVMRKLEEAKFDKQITVPMVEQAIHVMRAIKSLEDGDFTQLAEVVARAARCDHDEAMKRFVKGVKISPEGRASRQAAEDARREAAETRAQLDQLRRQLEQGKTAETEAQTKAEKERRVQQQHAVLLDDIQEQLDGHAVLGLPKGAERVKAYLIRTADPKLKAFKYSYAQVADKIVAGERRRLQSSRHLLDEGDEPASREAPRRSGNGSVSRTETVDAGVPSTDPMVRFDHFFDKHMSSERRAVGRRR